MGSWEPWNHAKSAPESGAAPVRFSGTLHWFVYDHGIVAFDPHKDPKSCRLIMFQADRDAQSKVRHDGLYRLCDGCQGKRRFFKWRLIDLSSSDPELKSWLMKATFSHYIFPSI
ncbi:hypothetical protein Hanom_Chr10g00899951 [Helianthus anomalus]